MAGSHYSQDQLYNIVFHNTLYCIRCAFMNQCCPETAVITMELFFVVVNGFLMCVLVSYDQTGGR